jgi:hypothetical protein
MRIESVLSSGSVSRRSTAQAEMPGVSAARGTQASDIGRGHGARAWEERNEGGCCCDKWKPVRVVLLSTAGRDPVCSDGLNMSRALAAEVCVASAKDDTAAEQRFRRDGREANISRPMTAARRCCTARRPLLGAWIESDKRR